MPQDPNEFATDLQNLISEALAAGIPEAELAQVLTHAAEQLEADDDADTDDDSDNPA